VLSVRGASGSSLGSLHGSAPRSMDDDYEDDEEPDKRPCYEEAQELQKDSRKRSVSSGQIKYLESIENLLEAKDFDTEEDFEMLIANVHSEIEGSEVALMVNGITSHVLELILRHSSHQDLRCFVDALQGRFYFMCTNRSASHPFQVILSRLPELLILEGNQENVMDTDELENIPSLTTSFSCMFDELAGQYAQLMRGSYSSFVLRDILKVLAGCPSSAFKKPKKKRKFKESRSIQRQGSSKIPATHYHIGTELWSHFEQIIQEIVELENEEFMELCYNQHGSPVLQLVLDILSTKGLDQQRDLLINRILQWDLNTDGEYEVSEPTVEFVDQMMIDVTGSHLMERVMDHCSNQVRRKIMEHHMAGNLRRLSLNPCANYSVQKFLTKLCDKKSLKKVLKEIRPHAQVLFDSTRVGVIRALVEACSAINCKTKACLALCCEAVSVETAMELVVALLSPVQSDRRSRKSQYNSNNALLLSALLKFQHDGIAEVYAAMAGLEAGLVRSMAQDSVGSRVVDNFLYAGGPGFKLSYRHNFICKMKGHFATLAQNMYGSFCVEKCCMMAKPKLKKQIGQELSNKLTILNGSKFGKRVLDNLRMDVFRQNTDQWIKLMKRKAAKRLRTEDGAQKSSQSKRARTGEAPDMSESKTGENTQRKGRKRKRSSSFPDDGEDSGTIQLVQCLQKMAVNPKRTSTDAKLTDVKDRKKVKVKSGFSKKRKKKTIRKDKKKKKKAAQ